MKPYDKVAKLDHACKLINEIAWGMEANCLTNNWGRGGESQKVDEARANIVEVIRAIREEW